MIISYENVNIALLKAKNFMQNIKQDNIIIKTINIHKINKLIKDK